MHRYTEIEAFPKALNASQMWNWSTRLFLTDAKTALAQEEEGGDPARWTADELAALEKTLIEHETWLNEAVERQKAVAMYDDPAVEAGEMRRRAKVLEGALQRLAKRKAPPKRKPASSSSSSSATASESSATSTAPEEKGTPAGHDEL